MRSIIEANTHSDQNSAGSSQFSWRHLTFNCATSAGIQSEHLLANFRRWCTKKWPVE